MMIGDCKLQIHILQFLRVDCKKHGYNKRFKPFNCAIKKIEQFYIV